MTAILKIKCFSRDSLFLRLKSTLEFAKMVTRQSASVPVLSPGHSLFITVVSVKKGDRKNNNAIMIFRYTYIFLDS